MPFAQYTRPDNVPLPKHSSPAPLTPGRSSTTSEREFCSPTTYRSHPAAPSSLAVVGFLLSSSAVLLLLAFLVTASSVTAVTTTPFYEQNKRIRATDVLLLSGIITLGQLPICVEDLREVDRVCKQKYFITTEDGGDWGDGSGGENNTTVRIGAEAATARRQQFADDNNISTRISTRNHP
ncbi:hypothetical protein V495_06094 [Pseudogymnoascus sp. VKM F-4514 (FW-929)]|nr:hypothetical protein V495_06094 [Pseudogymnoascus sp. VKM F-4514 (FW-929)]KFY54870.1 hypothetical protein V497_07377 [Pseudogymnoascus sp. VKM F-4516 (FW-969)]